MSLPRTLIGFSSTDCEAYQLMRAWKANKHIDFDFHDCQLEFALRSEDERYIKRRVGEELGAADTFIQLIGEDTRYKYKYVRWESEVAIEMKARLICVNLNDSRRQDGRCPPILRDAGALFVPRRARILTFALEDFSWRPDGHWYYPSRVYETRGYPSESSTLLRDAPIRQLRS
jgi:MTH538 TIR-like domain (DUF1863)